MRRARRRQGGAPLAQVAGASAAGIALTLLLGRVVPSAIGIGVSDALAGALVGMFVARSLSSARHRELGRRSWVPGAVGAVGFAAVMAFCLPTHVPRGAATIALGAVHRSGRELTASATITIRPAGAVSDPDYVQQLSWQGHAKSIQATLSPIAPGVYRTAKPLPLSGTWKSLIRFQQGRARGDVPVYLPADPAIPAAAIPAKPRITRAIVSDPRLMQRERKRDVPAWLWSVATTVVLAIIALLVAIIGWGLARVADRAQSAPPPSMDALPRVQPAPRLAPVGAGR